MRYPLHKVPRGFTLIEILVVLLIIGIVVAGTVLSTGVIGRDSDLEKERDRVSALFDYLRDQAALQNREFGMRCYVGGYEFLVYDARAGQWQRLQDDPLTRQRRLPAGVVMDLSIEGRPVVLPDAEGKKDGLTPQIMLFSSGDLNLFELVLRRDAPDSKIAWRFAPAAGSDQVEITELAAGSA